MDKIDKTKENLGVHNLQENERKEMFDKLVKGGGKVVDDRQKRRSIAMDREKQRQFKEHLDSHKNKIAPKRKPQAAAYSAGRSKSTSSSGESVSDFFGRFKIRLKLRFLRVAKSGGFFFNNWFLEKFNNRYKPAMINLQVVYLELLKKDQNTASRITDRLDSIKPLYFELIEMTGDIYNKPAVDQIVDHYLNFSGVPKKVYELRDPMMEIFRKLFILKPYENSILNAFETAVQIYKKLDTSKNSNITSLSKKIDSDLFILFHKLYPRLHLLFCHFNGHLFEETDPEIENILSISLEEKPGSRVTGKNREFIQQGESGTDVQTGDGDYNEEDIDISAAEPAAAKADPLAEGYRMINEIDVNERKKLYDSKRLFESIDDNDKIFYTFMYFTAFDREYSALLTTGKIKYRVDFADRSKVDYKQKLLSLYDEMRGLYESFKDYTEATAHYEKLKNERPIGSSGYIDYSKKLDLLHRKRVDTGKMARMKVKAFMDRVAEAADDLLYDISSDDRYIDNPDDILQFSSVEGNEKINGKTIIEAINTVYLFSAAFSRRLGPSGDLAGGMEFEPGTKPARSSSSSSTETVSRAPKPDMINIDDKGSPGVKEGDKKSSPKQQGSVLDELDDYL